MSIITSAIVSSAPFCRQISASPHLIEREALNDIFEHEPIVATYAFELYIYWRFIVSCLYILRTNTRMQRLGMGQMECIFGTKLVWCRWQNNNKNRHSEYAGACVNVHSVTSMTVAVPECPCRYHPCHPALTFLPMKNEEEEEEARNENERTENDNYTATCVACVRAVR